MDNYNKIEQLINKHIDFLKQTTNRTNLPVIYDFPVYSSIFIDDVIYYTKKTKQNSKVLDLGCGRGTSTYVLSELGYNVTGLEIEFAPSDLHEKLTSYVLPIDEQKNLNKQFNNQFKKSIDFKFYKGQKLPFEDCSFDSVFAYAVLEHVDNLQLTLSELNRILKKGGNLFISRTPNKYSYSEAMAKKMGMLAHDNLYTKKEITKYIQDANFLVKDIQRIDFFPSNIPSKLNKNYQNFANILLRMDKIIRKTPLSLVSHHFRIFCSKV